jgi:hypothetical protein
MQWCNLDTIVRRSLLEKGLPIHYYAEYLFHQAAAIRELAKDSLQIINTVNLPVNDYKAVDLPSDFKDDVAVCVAAGDLMRPIPKRSNINPIRVNNTTTGAFEPRQNNTTANTTLFPFLGINTGYIWFWNVNDYGEPTGRYFGANGGNRIEGYRVVKERRQIQLTASFPHDSILLVYVSNGQHIDNATQVDWDAHAAIQAYCNWKTSKNAAIKDSYEAATYYNERRLFRANKDDLTVTDIKNIIRSNYTATIKT